MRTSRVVNGIDVSADEALQRANLILVGIPSGAKRAVGSALSRAANSGKTAVKGFIADEYTISKSLVTQETKNINHYKRTSDGEITVEFGFKGCVIPLAKFDTTVSNRGVVTSHVKKSNPKVAIDGAFGVTVNSHHGVFKRKGYERFPIKELFGPATTQMIYSNELILDKVKKTINNVFESRVEHEITRLLNGW